MSMNQFLRRYLRASRGAILTAILLLPTFAYAQEAKASTKLVVPALVLTGVQGGDLWSTYRARSSGNGVEGNPVMNFGTAGQIAVKAGVTVASIYIARQVEKAGHPRVAKVTLYSFSAVIGSIAIHNERIARR